MQKIALHFSPHRPQFRQGEVWWCSLGMNVGDETFGKGKYFSRPVLIFKKFTHTTFLGLPLTSQEKTGSWYVEFVLSGVQRWLMLNQARVLDARRLQERVGELSDCDQHIIRKRFVDFYGS